MGKLHWVVYKSTGSEDNFIRPYWTCSTLVPDVFLDVSPHERAARVPRSSEQETRSGEKEKPVVTLDLNLTFMQTPAVKRVNLIIKKGANKSFGITCLSAANVPTRVVKSGIFWPTWPGAMCMFARMFPSATIAKVLFVRHYEASISTLRFVRRPRDFWIERHKLFSKWCSSTSWLKCHGFAVREYESPPETSEHTTKIMTRRGYE